jgi:hypothetical protein
MSPIAISGLGTEATSATPQSVWPKVMLFGAGVVAGYLFVATIWPPKKRRRA